MSDNTCPKCGYVWPDGAQGHVCGQPRWEWERIAADDDRRTFRLWKESGQ